MTIEAVAPGGFARRLPGVAVTVGLLLALAASALAAGQSGGCATDSVHALFRSLAATRTPAPRPKAYLLANNPAANATWATLRASPHDVLVLFNRALPLPHLRAERHAQRILMLRMYNRTELSAIERLTEFAAQFDKIVLLATKALQNPQTMSSVHHFEAIEWPSQFLDEVMDTYPNSLKATNWDWGATLRKGGYPSSGYIAFRYAQKYWPLHTIVLVGFTGHGKPAHNFMYEQQVYNEAGVVML